MKAILSKVVVKPIKEESFGDFIVSSEKENKFSKGKVVSAGEDVTMINDGDIVYYDKGRSSKIHLLGEVFDVMDKMNIFVVE